MNCTYQGDDEIGKLIHDLKCDNPNDMYNPILKERNKYLKETKEGQKVMCEAWEEERQSGKLEGDVNRMIASLKSLIKNANMTLEEAMRILELSEEEKQICREKLA